MTIIFEFSPTYTWIYIQWGISVINCRNYKKLSLILTLIRFQIENTVHIFAVKYAILLLLIFLNIVNFFRKFTITHEYIIFESIKFGIVQIPSYHGLFLLSLSYSPSGVVQKLIYRGVTAHWRSLFITVGETSRINNKGTVPIRKT